MTLSRSSFEDKTQADRRYGFLQEARNFLCHMRIFLVQEAPIGKVLNVEDDFALTREDSDSEGEQRFVTLGMSGLANLLVVVYAYRESDIIRIISAWKANRSQRLRYEKDRC